MKHKGRILRLSALCGVSLLLAGCISSMLATMAVRAPNQQQTPRTIWDEKYALRFDALYSQAWRLRVVMGKLAAD